MALNNGHKTLLNACVEAIIGDNRGLNVDISPFSSTVDFPTPEDRTAQVMAYLVKNVESRSGRKLTVRPADDALFVDQPEQECLYLVVCYYGSQRSEVTKLFNGMVLLRLTFSENGFLLGAKAASPGIVEGRRQHKAWLKSEEERAAAEAEAAAKADEVAAVALAEADVADLTTAVVAYLRRAAERQPDPLVREAVLTLLPPDSEPDLIAAARAARELKWNFTVAASVAIVEENTRKETTVK